MDRSRVFLFPFHPTHLVMVGIFGFLLTFFMSAGYLGLYAAMLLLVWVFKYCYVLIEHIADGAAEPPVMDLDMLSPFEIRPWVQTTLLMGGAWICYRIGGHAGIALGLFFAAMLPATVAILAMGEPPWQVVNPLLWFRVIRGMGPFYAMLLGAMLICAGIFELFLRVDLWSLVENLILLWCGVAFFTLVGASLFLRRRQLGYEPSRSPERLAARAESERAKVRARMIDDVFQLVRIGKHVDATAPIAAWMSNLEPEHVSKDAYHIAEQALRWEVPAALSPIGSTLIRHLMRYGRPDAALAVFEILRKGAPNFTMDSAADLRTLAEYADSIGRESLAQSMRLETPIFQPPR